MYISCLFTIVQGLLSLGDQMARCKLSQDFIILCVLGPHSPQRDSLGHTHDPSRALTRSSAS